MLIHSIRLVRSCAWFVRSIIKSYIARPFVRFWVDFSHVVWLEYFKIADHRAQKKPSQSRSSKRV